MSYFLYCATVIGVLVLLEMLKSILDKLEFDEPPKHQVWRRRVWVLKHWALGLVAMSLVPVLIAAALKTLVIAYLWL